MKQKQHQAKGIRIDLGEPHIVFPPCLVRSVGIRRSENLDDCSINCKMKEILHPMKTKLLLELSLHTAYLPCFICLEEAPKNADNLFDASTRHSTKNTAKKPRNSQYQLSLFCSHHSSIIGYPFGF